MGAPVVQTLADHRGRERLVDQVATAALAEISDDDVLVAVQVLSVMLAATRAEEERVGRLIPTDCHGNPLPRGEDVRRLWSTLNDRAEQLQSAYLISKAGTTAPAQAAAASA